MVMTVYEARVYYFQKFGSLRVALEKRPDEISSEYGLHPERDVRVVTFSRLANLLRSFELGLLNMLQMSINPSQVDKIFTGKLDQSDIEQVVNNYATFNKLGYLYQLTQILESFIRPILRHIYPGNKATGSFRRAWACVHESLKIDDDKTEFNNAIDLLYTIRNTIHNNGVYLSRRGSNKTIKFKDKEHKFIHEWPHHSAGLDTLYQITEETINLFNFVIAHPKVASHEIIPDLPQY